MKRLMLLLLVSVPCCAWDCGVNFRATSGAATDPAYAVFNVGASKTASTANGDSCAVTVSPTLTSNARDRTGTPDPRLKGVIFNGYATGITITLTLPATGTYNLSLAMGDLTSNQGAASCTMSAVFYDNTTVLFTASYTGALNFGNFIDASGTSRTTSAWPGSNTAVSGTFATTTLKVVLTGSGSGCAGTSVPLAHLRATAVSSATRRRGPQIVAMMVQRVSLR